MTVRPQRAHWKAQVMVNVPRHRPMPGHAHPQGEPFRYCVCGEAIVHLAGIWWHLERVQRRPGRRYLRV